MDKEQIRTEIKDLSYGLQFHTEQADFHQGVAGKLLKTIKRHEGQLVDTQFVEKPSPDDHIVTVLGNFPADLAAMQEDLEEILWESEGFSYSAMIDRDGDLRITCPQLTDKRMIVEAVGIPAFIRNLQRLYATHLRSKANG